MTQKISKERARTILSGGSEPQVNATVAKEDIDIAIEKSLYWYRQNFKPTESKGWIVKYLRDHGRTEDAAVVGRAEKSRLRLVAPYCRMVTRGFPFADVHKALIEKNLGELLDHARGVADAIPIERVSVQDRVVAKADVLLSDLEPVIDETTESVLKGKRKDNALLEWISRTELTRPLAVIVRDRLAKTLEEMLLAQAGTDPDLVEGYSHFKKTALKNMVDTLTSAVQNLNDRIGILKSNKKPRKQKRKSPESQIKRLHFLQRSDAFAIDSINPVDIIGAQRLIMYNTKNKKAILLIAVEPKSGLAVKGSTIIGFDSAKSFEKTIRNPDEFLKNQNDCRKTVVTAIRYLTGLKTKSSEPTGRVNSNCLILQVQ